MQGSPTPLKAMGFRFASKLLWPWNLDPGLLDTRSLRYAFVIAFGAAATVVSLMITAEQAKLVEHAGGSVVLGD